MSAVRNKDGIFINTEVFREEARHFEKYGVYPGGPPDDNPFGDYMQYWSEQNRRCIEGYSVGGVRITGDHYNYLNFNQIRLKENEEPTEQVSKRYYKRAVKKKIFFPDFWDGDYDYFHVLDIAERGIPEIYGVSYTDPDIDEKVIKIYNDLQLGVNIHLDDLAGGCHVLVAKARRKGFSFKNGSLLVNRYKRVPNFTGVLAAHEMKYITPQGTMDMCNDYIDFMNTHTAWARIKSIDKKLHQKDAYEEITLAGVKVEKGYKSQIIGLTCKDNPSAIRGKDPDMVMMEEGGTWPNFEETLAATLPSLGAGRYTTGLLVAFGTGSAETGEWEAFEENFYEPKTNNFIRIENQWDPGGENTFCSFYFPDCKNKEGFYDKNGNSDMVAAKKYEEDYKEELKKNTSNQKKIQLRTIEQANCPQETFAVLGGNIFPTEELKLQRRKVLHNLKGFAITGRMEGSIGESAKFHMDPDLIPVDRYPHKKDDDVTGCVVQYFPPFRTKEGVPENLYIICHDPYDKDESTDKSSLGATYVIMNPNDIVPGMGHGNIIVASYVGRPDLDTYNETLFLLATYYNAKIGFENDRGDVIGYAKRNRKCFTYLEPEFHLGWTDGMNNRLGRSYGMSMSGGKENKKKRYGDLFINEWLREVRGVTENGEIITNLNLIYDVGLLDELIKFNERGNFDRVSALRIGMYHKRELLYNRVTATESGKSSVSSFLKQKMCG